MKPGSLKEAYKLLDELGAPEHLKTHVGLVGEAAEVLIEECINKGIKLNFEFVRVGVAIHDVGKTIHRNEMTGPGSEHEPAGQELLLKHGVTEDVARVCMSHARWHSMECSTEELLIALSDKLWKGKREETLELKVIDELAKIEGKERWDLYQELDACFEKIASSGHDRLQRSVS